MKTEQRRAWRTLLLFYQTPNWKLPMFMCCLKTERLTGKKIFFVFNYIISDKGLVGNRNSMS